MPRSPRSDRIAELEAALQARWDLETLAVYADCLQSAGDPRGELIAIDLAIAEHGPSPELAATRSARRAAWLGTATLGNAALTEYAYQFGMLESLFVSTDRTNSYLEELIASPVFPYVRGLTLYGTARLLAASLELLAMRPLPWLRRLALHQSDKLGPVPPAIMTGFVAAAPYVEELALDGTRILATPCHPSATTLRVAGGGSIVVRAAAMPNITTIDVDLTEVAAGGRGRLAAMLSPRTFPALRRLDLARSEYVYPTALDANAGVYAFVLAIEEPTRLAELRLPAVRDAAQAADLRTFVARAPDVAIEIARMYRNGPDLGDLPAHVRVPAPRPWPPRDQISGRHALTISPVGEEIALSSCTELLERDFDTMPEPARAAWVALWAFLDGLGWEDDAGNDIELAFSAEVLVTALAALPEDHRCATIVRELRALDLPPGAEVTIKRYWGW